MVTKRAGDNITEVTWAMESSMPYPVNLLKLFIDFDQSLGEDYEHGLNKLKAILESNQFSVHAGAEEMEEED